MRTFPFAAIGTMLLAACAGSATPEGPRHALRLRTETVATLAASVRVVVVVENAAGNRIEANDEAETGGTGRGLCESLLSSLKYRGCEAHYEDGDPAESDPLARAMHQVVLLPAGWSFVSADARSPDGAPSAAVKVSMESRE